MFLVDLLFGLVALTAFLLGALVFTQALTAVLAPRRGDEELGVSSIPSFVVVVPAHDEQAGIEATLTDLKSQLDSCEADRGRIVVVADNCTDGTADVARAAGVEVLERQDPERRGKGFAIAFALDALAEAPPEVVVIVDADCRFETRGGLRTLVGTTQARQRPVQSRYLLTPPPDPSPKTRVSAFAVVFKNAVRTRGMGVLGLPVPLLGSGMAFPWAQLRAAPATEGYLVEDMLIGIELAKMGTPPAFLESVVVSSPLPTGEDASSRQRRRWEHGHLETIKKNGIPTLVQGVRTRSVALSAMALDLVVPPLALFLAGLSGLVLLTAIWSFFGSDVPLNLSLLAFLAVFLGTGMGWLKFGQKVLPPSDFGHVLRYVMWKLPLYRTFFEKGSHGSWERTARDGESKPDDR